MQPMTPPRAVFLSYASQDADAARRICEALQAAGLEVWLDQSELRGGDAWDNAIRRQIKACALFMPIISANTRARTEGYFRLEWKLAVDRSHLMADERAFILPVVIDATHEADALVPDKFRQVQWTHLPAGETSSAFVARVARLLSTDEPLVDRSAPAPTAARVEPPAWWKSKRKTILIAAVVVFAIVMAVFDDDDPPKRAAAVEAVPPAPPAPPAPVAIPEKSVAVLPFVDMSEKKDQEYFADGLSEELMGMLTKVTELKVPARTSSFSFKGKQATIADIAKALGVAHVLEGSVRKSGTTLRVTAQLIRVDGGYQVWSETYDRKLDDVFKVQDEIAAAVVKALKVSLLEGDVPKAKPAANQEAYALYLQARTLHYRGSHADNLQAIRYLERALKLDPAYAPAWFGLADTLVYDFSTFGGGTYAEVHPRARAAGEKAIKLDPKLADAHLAMARILGELEWNWPAADAELKRTLELSPNNVLALEVASGYALIGDRPDDALMFAQRAAARDAVAWDVYSTLGDAQSRRGQLAEAEALYRKAIELNPTAAPLRAPLGLILLARGEAEAALPIVEKEADDAWRLYGLALVYDELGRDGDADRALATLGANHAASMSWSIASVHACRKQMDQAFIWLERSYRQREGQLPMIKSDTCIKSYQSDPRFKELLRKLNLPP
jgi:TolB-like protein